MRGRIWCWSERVSQSWSSWSSSDHGSVHRSRSPWWPKPQSYHSAPLSDLSVSICLVLRKGTYVCSLWSSSVSSVYNLSKLRKKRQEMSQNVNALATFTFYRLPRSRLPLIRSVSASASLNLINTNLKSNTYRWILLLLESFLVSGNISSEPRLDWLDLS